MPLSLDAAHIKTVAIRQAHANLGLARPTDSSMANWRKSPSDSRDVPDTRPCVRMLSAAGRSTVRACDAKPVPR